LYLAIAGSRSDAHTRLSLKSVSADGGTDFFERQAGRGLSGDAELSLGIGEEEEVPRELTSSQDPGSPSSPYDSGVWGGDGVQVSRTSAFLSQAPSFLERLEREDEAAGEGVHGTRLYVRLVLGRQKATSWIKRERGSGAANWHQVGDGAGRHAL
jgi:hypothetical protein